MLPDILPLDRRDACTSCSSSAALSGRSWGSVLSLLLRLACAVTSSRLQAKSGSKHLLPHLRYEAGECRVSNYELCSSEVHLLPDPQGTWQAKRLRAASHRTRCHVSRLHLLEVLLCHQCCCSPRSSSCHLLLSMNRPMSLAKHWHCKTHRAEESIQNVSCGFGSHTFP